MLKTVIILLEKFASFFKLGIFLYTRSYKRIIENEIALARVDAGDTVLNVGCGSIPFTAIQLAKEAQCRVIAIDTDKKAVRHARRVIRKLKLESLVTVHLKDGTESSDFTYNKAILALQTRPLKTVLDTIYEPSRTVVVRIPFEKYQTLYDPLPTEYCVDQSVYQPMKAFGYSAVIIKR